MRALNPTHVATPRHAARCAPALLPPALSASCLPSVSKCAWLAAPPLHMVVASKRATQRAVRFRSPETERAEAMLASLGQLALLAVLWPILLTLEVLGWAEHGISVLLGVYFGLLQVCE